MTGTILSYRQIDPVKLQCKIDLKKLLPAPKQRERFNKKWNNFLESDPCNKDLFELKGDRLKYQSEQLIPSKSDDRLPLLLVLGNPASHSVKEGMFFSFEGDKKEHRFWKIMRTSRVLDLPIESHLSVKEQNHRRKKFLLELKYETPFRVGLCVFISIPSSASKDYSGVAGIQKLIGAKAMKELEKEETRRVIECAKKFLTPNGIAVAFQKNAWNALRSKGDPEYKLTLAKEGKLNGRFKEMMNIPLFGVPPTRLSGPCSRVFRKLLKGYNLP
ncbi:MAG: hypothetical protein SRB2_03112 [Desulfobacteraceae bacterium Eth-SRB2]|nr:MAG: hypothetical protein SRB2_03112 [Desulfobacteraceae bacterium Eth-SRB2]